MTHDPDPMAIVPLAQAAPSPTRTAEQILAYVRRKLYADHVGVTLIRGQKLDTVAATDGLVAWFDVLQSELGEGPCWDCSWQRQTLLVGDLAADRRWPRWAARVTALGISSVLAVELRGHEARRMGSIKVYWAERQTFADDDITFVNTFADRAARALIQTWNDDGFELARDNRKLIGQAHGVPVERCSLDEARAIEVSPR